MNNIKLAKQLIRIAKMLIMGSEEEVSTHPQIKDFAEWLKKLTEQISNKKIEKIEEVLNEQKNFDIDEILKTIPDEFSNKIKNMIDEINKSIEEQNLQENLKSLTDNGREIMNDIRKYLDGFEKGTV